MMRPFEPMKGKETAGRGNCVTKSFINCDFNQTLR
jgi:hypothetical protein